MYGKVFEQMYHGSMVISGWEALVTMQQLIVLADRDGLVDMTSNAISNTTTIPLDIIEKGLDVLSKPDPLSRTKDEDGRRIVLIDPERPWGWRLVNYKYYAALSSKEDKRIKDAARLAEKRNENNNSQNVAGCRKLSQDVANVAHVDVDVDINKNKRGRFAPPSLSEVTEYCKSRHNSVDPQKFIDHYQANGWVRGKTKISDWRACVRTWEKDRPKDEFRGAV